MKTMLKSLLAGATLLSAVAAPLAQEMPETPVALEELRVIGPDGTPGSAAAPPPSEIERYCGAIADPARDARTAMQTERLAALEAEIDQRIDALEAKRAEYQEWLDKRQAFMESTSTVMLDIYAAMRPDAAAAQLAGLERESAASILARLKSRQSSAILSEMPAPVASELAALIVRRTDAGLPAASAAAPVAEVRS